MVGTTGVQQSILDRDGRSLWDCVKGDPYVTDMARATGHAGSVTGVG